MELFFRRAFSKGSASPSPFCEPVLARRALFSSFGQLAGGRTEVYSDDLFGTSFRPDGSLIGIFGTFVRPAGPKGPFPGFGQLAGGSFGPRFPPDGPRPLFPGSGQLPGGSPEVASEGMFGARFRPDGPKAPSSRFRPPACGLAGRARPSRALDPRSPPRTRRPRSAPPRGGRRRRGRRRPRRGRAETGRALPSERLGCAMLCYAMGYAM